MNKSVCLGLLACALVGHALGAQPVGRFDTRIGDATYSESVSLYVPPNWADAPLPLIIALHPAQTPASIMLDLMLPAAEKLNALIACPDSPDGYGHAIELLIELISGVYRVDPARIILTGYSAGGYPALAELADTPRSIAGVIAIAPAGAASFLGSPSLARAPIALIVGQDDSFYADSATLYQDLLERGLRVRLVAPERVGHIDPYFSSPAFTKDWLECYEWCLDPDK